MVSFTIRLTHVVTLCALVSAPASLASAQATLRITSPADGTVIRPSESVTVRVTASGEAPKGVFVSGTAPIGFGPELVTAPPYNFTVEIPKEINSGPYNLTAGGFIAAGHDVKSDTVTIDVERADSPMSLHSEDFSSLRVHVGRTTFTRIVGVFGDGTSADLQQSTLTTFRSDNAAVATVGPYGLVTGVAPGSTKMIVTNGRARLEVPITVLRNDEE